MKTDTGQCQACGSSSHEARLELTFNSMSRMRTMITMLPLLLHIFLPMYRFQEKSMKLWYSRSTYMVRGFPAHIPYSSSRDKSMTIFALLCSTVDYRLRN